MENERKFGPKHPQGWSWGATGDRVCSLALPAYVVGTGVSVLFRPWDSTTGGHRKRPFIMRHGGGEVSPSLE